MTVRLVANKQDKPSSQIWRWNWLTTNKTNQTRWLMTSEFGSSWWGIKRVWLITNKFVILDGITSSSVSCWEQQSLTRKIFGLVDVEYASQDHLVCFHLLTILTGQSHISKVVVLSKDSNALLMFSWKLFHRRHGFSDMPMLQSLRVIWTEVRGQNTGQGQKWQGKNNRAKIEGKTQGKGKGKTTNY